MEGHWNRQEKSGISPRKGLPVIPTAVLPWLTATHSSSCKTENSVPRKQEAIAHAILLSYSEFDSFAGVGGDLERSAGQQRWRSVFVSHLPPGNYRASELTLEGWVDLGEEEETLVDIIACVQPAKAVKTFLWIAVMSSLLEHWLLILIFLKHRHCCVSSSALVWGWRPKFSTGPLKNILYFWQCTYLIWIPKGPTSQNVTYEKWFKTNSLIVALHDSPQGR